MWTRPSRRLACLVAAFCLSTTIAAGERPRTFTGIITDDMCWKAGHAHMGMGSTDAECIRACVAEHGAVYVLKSGAHVYTLSDQKTPERFANQRVAVRGTLDARTSTIHVDGIAPAR